MTNPLEQIRELADGWKKATVISEPVTPFQLLRACSVQILAILTASQGYVCVPVEPTQSMRRAGALAQEELRKFGAARPSDTVLPAHIYKAMLAASKETNRE